MRVATLELHIDIVDEGEPRERWNGGVMASREAHDALRAAADAAQKSLNDAGHKCNAGYGVTARYV